MGLGCLLDDGLPHSQPPCTNFEVVVLYSSKEGRGEPRVEEGRGQGEHPISVPARESSRTVPLGVKAIAMKVVPFLHAGTS